MTDWQAARDRFRAIRTPTPDDLAGWANAAWWLGLVDESVEVGARAFAGHLANGDPAQAATAAVGVALNFLLRGETSAGSGWLARAARTLADLPDAPEHAYLRYLTEVAAGLDGPELESVVAAAREVRAAGERFDDPTLVAVGVLGEGRALLKLGRVAEGLAALDEAMVAVYGDDLRPEWAGSILCQLIAAAHELGDLRRATEWVAATERWLRKQSQAVVFQGVCGVHRCQILQVRGDWAAAEQEARKVAADVSGVHAATEAEAQYTLGEISRLRGALVDAEAAYGRAHRLGRDPQPGLALLLLSRGRAAVAAASIRAALTAEPADRLARARLRAAQVEIAVAAGDTATASAACAELEETSAAYGSTALHAVAGTARGGLWLAEGNPGEALPVLRQACRAWTELGAPYEVARTRQLLSRAYRELDDVDAGRREASAAAELLHRLGAPTTLPDRLTAREAQVLALVAAGDTNRRIGAALRIADKTVARHLSNIFAKTGVTSRTEAAAYAYRHGLGG